MYFHQLHQLPCILYVTKQMVKKKNNNSLDMIQDCLRIYPYYIVEEKTNTHMLISSTPVQHHLYSKDIYSDMKIFKIQYFN
jgi:hypothetical protein